MSSSAHLSTRPSFIRAQTDESIIPMAHFDRRTSQASAGSHGSDPMSPGGSRRSSYFESGAPLARALSHTSTLRPIMPSPPDSPIQTGPMSRLDRARAVVAQPFVENGRVRQAAARVAPYWREGIFVATAIGYAVWLGIMSGRVQSIENIPFCYMAEGH